MDLHIAVIADLKNILEPYMEIVDWCMSGHHWAIQRSEVIPNHINRYTWSKMNPEMIQKFQQEYDEFLQTFDGFIVCYPGSFSLIYEKYNKPIIMVNACRYDMPFCWSKDMGMLNQYNDCLARLNEKRLLTAVSNNLADLAYMFAGSGIISRHIPSLCLYTKMSYNPVKNNGKFLIYTGPEISNPLCIHKKSFGNDCKWSDWSNCKGIIHFPYEISTMSMFEHFSAKMPLFFPSKKYMFDHIDIQSVSAYWKESPYFDFRFKEKWLDLSDIYNLFYKSPNVYFFDSLDELIKKLENFEWKDDFEFFEQYFKGVKNTWNELILIKN